MTPKIVEGSLPMDPGIPSQRKEKTQSIGAEKRESERENMRAEEEK